MRHAATILVVLAVATALSPSAAAVSTFTEEPVLTDAASVIPGQVTETSEPGPTRVYCWNEEAWSAAGWTGIADGLYDGFNDLPWYLCRRLLRADGGLAAEPAGSALEAWLRRLHTRS